MSIYILNFAGQTEKYQKRHIAMLQISDRVESLKPAATLAMSQKSAELRAQGIDVINMSVGEPDFNTPDFIKDAAKKAVDDNFTHYPPVPGYMSLRKAVADKLLRENGLEYAPEQIVVGNGAKQALCNTVLAVVNRGDEVVIPMPAWVSYVEMVKLADGVPVTVTNGLEDGFKITASKLESVITERTRLLMLCSPSNPSGAIYTAAELEAIAEVLRRHPRIMVISDEIYEHISYAGKPASIARCEGMKERTVIINGVSKAYAMTGWRIGYLAAPAVVAKAVSKLQGQYTSACSSIAQKAAEAAYTGPQECVEEMRLAFERRRNLIMELAADIPSWRYARPDGAFYFFPDVTAVLGTHAGDRRIETSGDYVMYLLEVAHVATVDGAAFGAPGYIRISYATSDDNIREAMRRIADATARLER